MANGASFMLACGYALYKGAHVRTDIFWEKYSERTQGRHRPGVLSGAVLSRPMLFMMWVGIDGTIHSYSNRRALAGERLARDHVASSVQRFRSPAVLFMIQGSFRVAEVLVPDP
jgi:hypothetical protein